MFVVVHWEVIQLGPGYIGNNSYEIEILWRLVSPPRVGLLSL